MNEMVVFDSIAHSNLRPSQKSSVMKFLDRHVGGSGTMLTKFGRHLSQPNTITHRQGAIRQHGESFVFGALLGAVNSSVGLEVGPKKNIPLDGVLAVLSLIGAYAGRRYAVANELNNLAASSFTVYGFRKSAELLGGTKALVGKVTSKVAGEDDSDPIFVAAQSL
jgi:hypothetical protein